MPSVSYCFAQRPNAHISAQVAKKKGTLLTFSGFGWYAPVAQNLDEGTSNQAVLPLVSNLHRFSGLLASPANLQLRPMMATGSFAESLLGAFPMICFCSLKKGRHRDTSVSKTCRW